MSACSNVSELPVLKGGRGLAQLLASCTLALATTTEQTTNILALPEALRSREPGGQVRPFGRDLALETLRRRVDGSKAAIDLSPGRNEEA